MAFMGAHTTRVLLHALRSFVGLMCVCVCVIRLSFVEFRDAAATISRRDRAASVCLSEVGRR